MFSPFPPTPTLPHKGGGSLGSPSPTRGEGALLLPPPWWGRVGVGGMALPPPWWGELFLPPPWWGRVGVGGMALPPPWWGREPCFSLPPGGGGSLGSPSPLVGEGWGGGEWLSLPPGGGNCFSLPPGGGGLGWGGIVPHSTAPSIAPGLLHALLLPRKPGAIGSCHVPIAASRSP